MLKKGVNSTTETRKWASATLVWSLNPWISCVWSILSKGPPLPFPPSLIFMASLPRYQKTYLLCTTSLEYSATVKKPKSILKSHWKSSLRLFLHRALQLLYFVNDQCLVVPGLQICFVNYPLSHTDVCFTFLLLFSLKNQFRISVSIWKLI